MAGSRRILRDLPSIELAEGHNFHNLTNRAFDSQPFVISLENFMKQSFKDFLPWRTAIQASRAGKDLLFDGTLMHQPSALDELEITLAYAHDSAEVLMGDENTASLVGVIGRLLTMSPPSYDQPEITSRALIHTLLKSRTPIGSDQLSSVTKVMSACLGPTLLASDEVMKGTLASLN